MRRTAAHVPATAGCLVDLLAARGHTVLVHFIEPLSGASAADTFARAGRDLAGMVSLGAPASGPAVVHALDPTGWLAAIAARRFVKLPTVLRFGEALEAGRTGPDPADADSASLTACLRAADAVAATSLAYRREVMARGVRGDLVQIVPDLVGALCTPVTDPPRSGRVACLTAAADRPDAPGLAGARRVTARLDRSEVVSSAGVTIEERSRLLDDADVLLCGAGAERAAVQAMWRGRPVLAPRSPVMDEVVVDRHTGFLYEDAEELARALTRLLASPFTVQALGMAGRRRAEERYSSRWVGEAAEHAYQLAGSAHRAARGER